MGTIRQKVALEGIRFFAFHGFYPEEQLTGNEFIVDIETVQTVFQEVTNDLEPVVNYEKLFVIAETRMKETKKLLETVAHSILADIHNEFMAVDYIRVSIRKMNLALVGEIKNSLVELTFKR